MIKSHTTFTSTLKTSQDAFDIKKDFLEEIIFCINEEDAQ